MTASLLALLQIAASVLTLAQRPVATTAFMKEAIQAGNNTIQLVTQVAAPIGFAVAKNDSGYPNVKDLVGAPYIDGQNHWSPIGATVQGIFQYTSYGDLNSDGFDDAVTVVNRPVNRTANYFLAVMLNQGGIMFNIADLPLGTNVDMTGATPHNITNGVITFGTQKYTLLGNVIQPVQ